MNFNKMKINKKGNIVKGLSEATVGVIMSGVFGLLAMILIPIFAPLIQDQASANAATATAANKSTVAAIYNIFGTSYVVEILSGTVVVLVIIFGLIKTVQNTTEGK